MPMPRALTPAKKAAIVKALRAGATVSAAYRSVGVVKSTYQDELDRDPDFAIRVDEARGKAQVGVETGLFLSATQKDAQGRRDSKAAIHWLNNQDADSWKDRRSEQVDVFHHDVAEAKRRNAKLSDEAKKRLRDIGRTEILGDDVVPDDATLN
jgi:hypothetical protein